MSASLRMFPLLVCLGLGPAPVEAQDDQGVLIIRQSGQEIGRETFRKVASRSGSGLADTLAAVARFPTLRPTVEINAMFRRSAPDGFTFLVNRRGNADNSQVLAAGSRSRITVRIVGRSGESAREFPGGAGIVLLEDSLFAPFLQVAELTGEKPTSLTALFPRSGRRVSFQAERIPATGNKAAGTQQIRLTGGIAGEITLDGEGRLLRVALPELGLEAGRAPE